MVTHVNALLIVAVHTVVKHNKLFFGLHNADAPLNVQVYGDYDNIAVKYISLQGKRHASVKQTKNHNLSQNLKYKLYSLQS